MTANEITKEIGVLIDLYWKEHKCLPTQIDLTPEAVQALEGYKPIAEPVAGISGTSRTFGLDIVSRTAPTLKVY